MIVERLSPRSPGGDAVLPKDSSGGGGGGGGYGDGESRHACHRCDDGERSEILHACISQLSNCCGHPGSASVNSANARSNHDTPSDSNHSTGPAKCPAQNGSTADASAANCFSFVDWIHHNLPCVRGSHHHHVLSSPGDQHHEKQHQQQQQQQNTQSGHEPLPPSDQQTLASCCHITQKIPSTITAPLALQQTEINRNTILHTSKDLTPTTSQTHQKHSSHPPSSYNRTFTGNANPSSSWLSGHLGLIQQNSSSQLPHSNTTVFVKAASLTKPSSFNKTPSCPQPYSRYNKLKETTTLTSKPPRPHSPAIPPPLVIRQTKSQIIASEFQKLGGSSRSNSRPNTPNSLPTDVHDVCSTITCLRNAQSSDGIDTNSSVGLNSVHEGQGRQRACSKNKRKSAENANSDSSCVVVVDPLLFSCGNHHNFEGSMFHQSNNNTDELDRTQSKLTVASQSTMNTGETSATNNTHTLHNILTKIGSNHASSSKTATIPLHETVGNIDVPNAKKKANATPKASNANGNTYVDGDSSLRSESSVSGNMPSQQPLLSNNLSTGDQPSTFATLRTWNKRSPSPFLGGTQVQLDKLLSRNNTKSNHCNSESGTVTTDGASGFDASTRSKGGDTSTFSSLSGPAAGEKRKVQWGVSTHGGSSKMPVLITANEHSTEVIKRESKARSSTTPSVDIKLYAKYHEEIVTALIDGALRAKDIEASSAQEPTSPTVTSTPEPMTSGSSTANAVTDSPRKSASTPIRKIPKSPHRTSFSTPIWKRNRSTIKLDSVVKIQKHEQKISEGNDSNIEKALSMFHFKTKQSAPSSHSSTTTLNKKPLEYFHPQCQLLKEKGSDKRKSASDSKTASAIGKEAVLEKLQEKLSMLGDIESGKFGKAAEMLQSDAVAFFIEGGADSINRGNQQGHVQIGNNNIGAMLRRTQSNITRGNANDTIQASSVGTSKKRKAMVETRSLLTLRMGFVSMSYGILLQWDCASKSVELIVLRKMCREDFLERHDEDSSDAPTVTKSPKPSTSAASTASGTTLESHESHSHEPEGFSRFFPQLLCEPDRRPQSFLSVSVVSVKHIHTGCALCQGSRQSDEGNATQSKTKRDSIRPYIRFVLGKNEHCTKPAKLLANGSLQYYKRHNNSCLLPIPREEFRWFAGQEDLIVELRDMQPITTCSEGGKNPRRNEHVPNGTNTNKYSSKNEQCSQDDPILAVVTVPLSSVDIEDGGDKAATSDDDDSAGLSLWKHRKQKKNEFIGKDEISSTNITLPLRMTRCSAASFGSISLQITIKAPYEKRATTSSVSVPSDSDLKAVNEPKVAVNESIEIGAIARLMQGLAIYDAAAAGGESDQVHPSVSSKSLRKKIPKQVPRWKKKWNPKTKKWSKLKLNNQSSSGREPSSEEANWFTFMKWGDDPTNNCQR